MNELKLRNILVKLLVLSLIYGCAISENYKMGQDLVNQNRWDEAISYFETAVKEDPANTEFKRSLLQVRQQVAKIHLEKAKQALSAAPARNLRALEPIAKEGAIAYNLDPGNPAVKTFQDQLQGKVAALQVEVKALYEKAEADILKEDWFAAVTKLRQVNQIYTGYEDTGNKLARAEQEGAKVLYQQGTELGKQEDWKVAAQAFKAAMEINPKYLDVARQYEQAKSRDNADYAINESLKAEKAQNWERAILLLEKAAEYQPDNRELFIKLDQLKVKVALDFFDDAVKQANQGRLYEAMIKIDLVKTYSPSLQTDPLFKEFIKNFCAMLMERAQTYGEKEEWGNALLWYQKVETLSPKYPELFQKLLEARDHINKRIKKSIAVFDFSSPSNNKDAGKIAANKLISYLHKNASGDLRIIERENLQSILREMQLGQTGLVDIKRAQNVGKMRGIDTFIMGDVLRYSTNLTDTPSVSQVKVLVDEEDVRNPEFSDWLIMHPKPTANDLKSAPPRTVKKRNYQFVSYKKGSAKIDAMLEVSYKLVDTSTGENIVTNTVSGKLVKEDKYQDGVPAANIPYDPLELPTELDVLDGLSNTKISEMGQSILKQYQSLEVEYFNAAQQQEKRRNIDLAIEKYTDAVYDEKLKGISTPISQKSQELINQLNKDRDINWINTAKSAPSVNINIETNIPPEQPFSAIKANMEAPVITITRPEVKRGLKITAKEAAITVAGRATDQNGVASVTVNEQNADLDENGNFTTDILLKVGENQIIVTAMNVQKKKSTQKFAIIREQTKVASGVQESTSILLEKQSIIARRGQYHALVIGNNDYSYLTKLQTAVNDAREVAKMLKDLYGFKTNLILNAKRKNILSTMNEYRKLLSESDNLLIYYAGHGVYDKVANKAYWLPIDAQRDDPSEWIIADDITSNVKRIASKHILIISDSCYSGTIDRNVETDLRQKADRDEFIKKMMDRPSRTLLASGGNEPVSDSGGGNHSIFADSLLKALKEIDRREFTVDELFYQHVRSRVAGRSEQVPEYKEIRNSGHEGGDFVFFKKE